MKYESYKMLNAEQKEEINFEVIEPSKMMIYSMLVTYIVVSMSTDKVSIFASFVSGLYFFGCILYYSHFKAKKIFKKFGVEYK